MFTRRDHAPAETGEHGGYVGQTSWEAGDRVGRYVLVEWVGSGAFSVVWRAHDAEHDRDVALKLLKPDRAASADWRAVVAREARALARLEAQAHVVDVYEYDLDGPVYLAMEFASGRDLDVLLDELRGLDRGGLGVRRSVRLVDQVAEALVDAHDRNLVHLDVSPRNVRVGPDDEVHLVDFGLVGAVGDAMLADAVMRGQGIGTARYMAPERLGRSLVAPAYDFDVYALGCILHECLTGRYAFDGRSVRRIERAAHRTRRPRPTDVDRGLEAFDPLVVDALALDAAHRPTAAVFRERLAHAAAGWEAAWGPACRDGGTAGPS